MKKEEIFAFMTLIVNKEGNRVMIATHSVKTLEKAFNRWSYGLEIFDPKKVWMVRIEKMRDMGVFV